MSAPDSHSFTFSGKRRRRLFRLVIRHHRHKLLDSLVLLHLARINVPLRVHSDRVDPVELAGVGAVPAEPTESLSAIAVENPDFVIRTVGHVNVLLLGIARERQFVSGSAGREFLVIQSAANLAAGRGIGGHVEFPDKLPLLREYLDPVLSTLADVDEAFFRELGEMQIWDEVLFLRRRGSGPLVSRDRIVRDLAQRHSVTAPAALEGRSEEHTSELQSPCNLVCRLLLEK